MKLALASVWGRDLPLPASLLKQRGGGGGGIPYSQHNSFLSPNSSRSFTFNKAGGTGEGVSILTAITSQWDKPTANKLLAQRKPSECVSFPLLVRWETEKEKEAEGIGQNSFRVARMILTPKPDEHAM